MLMAYSARLTDYPELISLWERSVLATHHFLRPVDRQMIKQDLPQYFDQVTLLKWQLDDAIVGFSGTSGTELVMLFLDPAYFRRGYGQQIIQQLGNIKRVTVNAQNPGALAFYQRQGFKIVSQAAVDGDGRPYPIINLAR